MDDEEGIYQNIIPPECKSYNKVLSYHLDS